jgi:hypothetical protein
MCWALEVEIHGDRDTNFRAGIGRRPRESHMKVQNMAGRSHGESFTGRTLNHSAEKKAIEIPEQRMD